MFLPPLLNMSIADAEGYPNASPEEASKWAVSYCTKLGSMTPGARLFPQGLLLGAHFLKGTNFVQITGKWNPHILSVKMDGGGYFDLDDNVNSPPGGMW